jgi:hypothetical protein
MINSISYMDLLEKLTLNSRGSVHYLKGSWHWLPAWGSLANSLRDRGYSVSFIYADGLEEPITDNHYYRPLVVPLRAIKLTREQPAPLKTSPTHHATTLLVASPKERVRSPEAVS